MLPSLCVPIPFGKAKVYGEHVVLSLATAHEEVVGLDVAVQVQTAVDVLDALDHLVGKH